MRTSHLRTYSHLAQRRRIPSEYDVATSKLLYYPGRGFEVETPVGAWYEKYQTRSPLTINDWEQFNDPRETVYSSYASMQSRKEAFVEGLLESADETPYEKSLAPDWIELLERVLAPLRYPCHGIQMAAAYAGHMAPSGKIVNVLLFQTADEIRRVQWFAYRMAQLRVAHAGFGDGGRAAWERDPLWQPLREAVERLLITYDWGEAFVALNLALKPIFDELFMLQFARLARSRGDDVLEKLLFSLEQDCAWHRQWSAALVKIAVDGAPGNRGVIVTWLERWRPRAEAAVAPFCEIVGTDPSSRIGFEECLKSMNLLS